MEINLDTIKFSEKVQIKILDLLWFLIIPIINVNYIIAGHVAKTGHDLTMRLDNIIKFESIFIIPYIYWYAYIVVGFILILINSRKDYLRTFICFFIGMSVCYIIYYIYPTEIQRPIVENTNILNKLVNLIYSADRPFNCFPSLHVLTTYFIMRNTKYGDSKKIFYYTQIVGVLIILSTVFIKQHFVLDILVAIILCEIVMYFVKSIPDTVIDRILSFPYEIKDKITNKVKIKYNKDVNINEINIDKEEKKISL